ncbi:MAG: PQQ-binding-like beta-propeller repeat protein [Deltaproteobacteria bacterium]|nr:PQQ-binding-like beta-propeller repeat protein [Deltaproteobacteria bacterium]
MPGWAACSNGTSAALTWLIYTADEDDAPSAWAAQAGLKTFVNAGFQKLVDTKKVARLEAARGTLSAIDLAAGEIRWQVPLGDYPKVLAAGRSGLGAENYGGPILTAGGLLFLAATPDAKLRAFEPSTGRVLWEASSRLQASRRRRPTKRAVASSSSSRQGRQARPAVRGARVRRLRAAAVGARSRRRLRPSAGSRPRDGFSVAVDGLALLLASLRPLFEVLRHHADEELADALELHVGLRLPASRLDQRLRFVSSMPGRLQPMMAFAIA